MKERSRSGRLREIAQPLVSMKIRWTSLAGIAFTLCIFMLGSGCRPTSHVTCSGNNQANSPDELVDGFHLPNARFRNPVAENEGLIPTDFFWFSRLDSEADRTIVYGWDDAFIQYREPQVASCDYEILGPGCRQCNYCGRPDGWCTNNVNSILTGFGSIAGLFKIGDADAAETSVRDFPLPYDGCVLRQGNPPPPSFVVEENATYRLRQIYTCGDVQDLATLHTKLVINTEPKNEPMLPYDDMGDPALRFTFSMPISEVDGKIRENFSPNIRVGKVRVLLGSKSTAMGEGMPKADPATLERVRPSRILFLNDFRQNNINDSHSETTHRCYFDPASPDGNFNLLDCLQNRNMPRVRFDVTPAYRHDSVTRTLTWVIEYKTADGLPAIPVFANTEELTEFPILQFELQ